MTWDPKGAYALDADEPLSPAAREMIKDLRDAEMGRAESLARYRLKVDREDLVPAWVLSQIVRVRKRALSEYTNQVSKQIDEPVSVPMLLYRLHICRIAEEEQPIRERHTGNLRNDTIVKNQKTLADRLRPIGIDRLGVAIGVTQVSPFWIVQDRETLTLYQKAHPKGPDIRPMIAQAYMSGVHVGPVETAYTDLATDPREARPKRGLEIANEILKDHPDSALGHYYAGVAQFLLKRTDLALIQFRAALATGKLPPLYEEGARNFVNHPSYPALRPEVVY